MLVGINQLQRHTADYVGQSALLLWPRRLARASHNFLKVLDYSPRGVKRRQC